MTFMEQHRSFPPQLGASLFVLPGLFPKHIQLLLDTNNHAVILLTFQEEALASFHPSFPLTPVSTRVFKALLRAYPNCCSYQSLLLALSPIPTPQRPSGKWDRHRALRPVRRAVFALTPVVQQFGLYIVSQRGQGYLLVPHTCLKEDRASQEGGAPFTQESHTDVCMKA